MSSRAQTRGSTAPSVARIDGYAPIEDYAAVGDGRTVALVARDGAVDWLTVPAIDSDAVFAALLDPLRCGRFAIAPTEPYEVTRRYVPRTNVLETTMTTADGAVTVTDALTLQDGGQLSWVELVRSVRSIRGSVRMRYVVRPRFRFGLASTTLARHGDAFLATCGSQTMAFRTWDAGDAASADDEIVGEFMMLPGADALLTCVFVDDQPIPLPPREEIELRLEQTADAWRRWIGFHAYDGPWPDAVRRSLLTLKLLIDARTGAIAAAPTTSLPERIGGERNWDYRYAWVRDSAFVLDALGAAGYREQVHASLSWALGATEASHPKLDPFYALHPGVERGERELELKGYRDSRPVRTGNHARTQLQLGSYGNLLETIELYVRHGNSLDAATRIRVGELADHVCRVWRKPDSGIWERDDVRHYTISKINCWVALDRAIRLAGEGEAPSDRVESWSETATRIRNWIDAHCWSAVRQSYTLAAGSDDLDAAVLLAARVGYLDADDRRLHSTIAVIRSTLSAGDPLLYRYTGQERSEGAFLACSFWLVEALARTGQIRDAEEAMGSLLSRANDVGVYSEELDPSTGSLLGNFPQALTHLALVNAAYAIAEASSGRRTNGHAPWKG